MFNNSSHIAISRGTFSIVHGNQYNVYHSHLETDGRTEFPPGDEWKIELHREYKRIPAGECNLLRTIGESTVVEYTYECDQWKKMIKAKRVFSVARLGDGRNGSRFTGVGYTGRDANKLFKQDCIDFSRIKHASIAQLHAFNDSSNPMIFFHDELIPLQYIMESHPDCRYVLSQYIAFQHVTILGECVPPFLRHLSQMWVRPQDGTIVCGPKGPGINARIPFVAPDIARTLQSRDLAPPMPLNLYHSRDLLNYLASWLSGGFIPPRPCYKGVRDPVSPFDLHLAVLSTSSASPNIIAKFLQSGGDVPWKYIGDHPLQVLMDDGRIRFQHNCPPRDLHSHGSFDVGHSDEEKLAFIWLAQASHVFERLNIPRNDWVDYGFIHRVSLNLVPRYTDGTSVSPFNNEAADEFEFPFYLLARPYPRFSDGFLDIMSWTSSTNLYYWSSDPDGHSEMTEEEHVVLGLPCYIPKVEVHMQTWELEDYDFMRELQEAKGFDSSTTNFARSIGVPILEIVYAENDRFEVFSNEEYSDENGSSVLTTISPARGNAMEVDFESHRDGTVASWPPEGVEDMDVDIEDCCSRMESLAVEVGMEVDN